GCTCASAVAAPPSRTSKNRALRWSRTNTSLSPSAEAYLKTIGANFVGPSKPTSDLLSINAVIAGRSGRNAGVGRTRERQAAAFELNRQAAVVERGVRRCHRAGRVRQQPPVAVNRPVSRLRCAHHCRDCRCPVLG